MNSILVVIVEKNKTHLLVRRLKEFNIGTDDMVILFGEGTNKPSKFDFLGLNVLYKEIVICRVNSSIEDEVFALLSDEVYIKGHNTGVAFTLPFVFPTNFNDLKGSGHTNDSIEDKEATCCLMTIVESGMADMCMDIAVREGAKGGTLIHGRGAGVPENFHFPIIIDPEKDIVINIMSKTDALRVKSALDRELELEKPGTGISFVLPVGKFAGFMQF